MYIQLLIVGLVLLLRLPTNKYSCFLSVRKHTCVIVLTKQCGPLNHAHFCGILHTLRPSGRMSVCKPFFPRAAEPT